MKIIICVLLTIAGMELASSLQCYICLTPTPSDQCVVKKNCSRFHSWCMTTVYGRTTTGFPFTEGRFVVRNCAERCEPTSPDFIGVVNPVLCCKDNLCITAIAKAHGLRETQRSYYTVTAAMYSIFTALQVTS